MRKWTLLSVLVAIACATTLAFGQTATVTNGFLNLGVNTYGNVFDPVSYTGLQLIGNGDDAISPGTPRSGWGVAANGVSGWADPYESGVVNLNFVSFANTASTVTSVTQLPGLLQVTNLYAPTSTPSIYGDTITFTNISGGTLSNVMYSQQTDWDVAPTQFYEHTTVDAWGKSHVVYTSAYGFESPDPLNPSFNCNYIAACNNVNGTFGPADLGEGIIKNFGTFAPGQSFTLKTYYGGDYDTASLEAELTSLGWTGPGDPRWEVFIMQSDCGGVPCTGNDTWVYAINETPEPGTLAMLGTGLLAGIGVLRRRLLR